MNDILAALSKALERTELDLRSLKNQLGRGNTAEKRQEVFLSVMMSQPLEDSEESAQKFNLATPDGVRNMLDRATSDKMFAKRVAKCVSRLSK